MNELPNIGDVVKDHNDTEWVIQQVNKEKKELQAVALTTLQILPPNTEFPLTNIFVSWEKQLLERTQKNIPKLPEIKELKEQREKEHREAKYPEIAMKLAHRQGFLPAAKSFLQDCPIYYDKGLNWWLWNPEIRCWQLSDETEILIIVKETFKLIGDVTVKTKGQMLEALRQEARKKKPKPFPKHWVQCRDLVFDLETGMTHLATPEYFGVNTIPWRIGESTETPVLDRLFTEWVGEAYVPTLYEILAYCMYADYPIHVLFCFVGSGRNGKSKYQQLIERFVGIENISTAELEAVCDPSNRFERFNLFKKLVCLMGETNFDVLRNTGNLKRLTGQDPINFEQKNKNAVTEHNYAKIIISTNALPSSHDTSEGFYRRWVIVDFPNEFPEGRDVLKEVSVTEYESLCARSLLTLKTLLDRGSFTGQGTIEERRQRYVDRSNPLMTFVEEFCVSDDGNYSERYSLLYVRFTQYLKQHKRRIVSRKEFSDLLESEGYEIRKTTLQVDGVFVNDRFVFGLRLKSLVSDFGKIVVTDMLTFPTHSSSIDRSNSKNKNIRHNELIARINGVDDSVLDQSPKEIKEEDFSFFWKPEEISNALSKIGPTTIEELKKLYPGPDLLPIIQELCQKGDLVEQPAGTYRIPGA